MERKSRSQGQVLQPVVGGDVHSWGSGEMGQLGFPLLEDLPKDQDGYPYEPTAGLIKAFARMKICEIAGGDGHTAAVTVHGKLYSWGASACGQLGHSDTEHMPKDVEGYPYQPVPLLVSGLQDVFIVQIACGDAHTVALSREGSLFSWGGGGCGQLGHSETSKMPKDEDGCPYQLTPRVVDHLRPHFVSTIACGKAHTIAVSDRGRMFTWGAGACGQLGHPDTSSFPSDEDGYPFQPVPREVERLADHKVIATACGDVHTLALTEIGYVFSFGGGSYGQLGVKDVKAMPTDADNCPYMPTPQRVVGLERIVRLACGDSHSLTVDRDGRLFCWGANSCGQLGISPDDPRIKKDPDGIPHLPTPALLEALGDQRVVDVACGEAHSLAVSASGNMYSWGACSCGQLGLGSCEGMPVDSDGYPYQPTPTLVTAGFQGKAVLKVACGGVHNLAVTEPDHSLANSLASLINSDMLADVCFRSSEGELLFAHTCIFKINAPSLFNFVQAHIERLQNKCGGDASGIDDSPDLPEVGMPNVRMEVLMDFMQYVYTLDDNAAAMSLSSFAAVLELYHLGAKFHLGLLLPKCRRIIRQQLGRQNIHQPWLPGILSTGGSTGSSDVAKDIGSAVSASASPASCDEAPAPLSSDGFGDDNTSNGWGIFFLPGGQALVLDGSAYRETLRRGTLLDLLDADVPSSEEASTLLEEHMRALLADESSSDVRLTVRGESGSELELSAHRCVLACRSAYFRALFASEFRERGAERLPLEDITPDQLLLLLNFIYTDDWMVEDADFALDMIPIADRFSVLDLKRLCERTLICTMCVENVARIFALADRYACTRLRGRALLFMTDPSNFHAVMKTDSFADLDKTLIVEILRNHRMTPAPLPPTEPLPGNSATFTKAGQTKLRDHRHVRGGGGGACSAPTARPTPAASSSGDPGTASAQARGLAPVPRGSSSSAALPAVSGGSSSSGNGLTAAGHGSSSGNGLMAAGQDSVHHATGAASADVHPPPTPVRNCGSSKADSLSKQNGSACTVPAIPVPLGEDCSPLAAGDQENVSPGASPDRQPASPPEAASVGLGTSSS